MEVVVKLGIASTTKWTVLWNIVNQIIFIGMEKQNHSKNAKSLNSYTLQ